MLYKLRTDVSLKIIKIKKSFKTIQVIPELSKNYFSGEKSEVGAELKTGRNEI